MIAEKKEQMSEKQYRALPMLSSSDLQLFTKDRKKFYQEKILGEKPEEEYSKAKLIGNLVHCLLLEPQEFDNKFYLSICNTPPTGMLLAFVEALYRHTAASMEDGVVTADFGVLAQAAYEDSGFKITLEAVLKKFTTPHKTSGEVPENYYKQMIEAKSQGLEVACVEDITIAEKIVQQIREDEFVGSIFQKDENVDDLNELQIEGIELDGLVLKGMVDKVRIFHDVELIQPYDVKVTYDVINFKRDYFLKRKSYIQGCIYYRLLCEYFREKYPTYLVMPPIFVVVHSGCFYKPLLFELEHKGLQKAYEGFTEDGREYSGVKTIIEDILWSQNTGNWNISKINFENNGKIAIFE